MSPTVLVPQSCSSSLSDKVNNLTSLIQLKSISFILFDVKKTTKTIFLKTLHKINLSLSGGNLFILSCLSNIMEEKAVNEATLLERLHHFLRVYINLFIKLEFSTFPVVSGTVIT